MLTLVGWNADRFHINVLCFVTAPHLCGAFLFSIGSERDGMAGKTTRNPARETKTGRMAGKRPEIRPDQKIIIYIKTI